MKIRIKDNSLRLRITQGELAQFEREKHVESRISFPNGAAIVYSLSWSNGDEYSVEFDGKNIRVSVPKSAGQGWLEPTEVGMETHIASADGESLRVLIEKDFACLTERVDEDESDNFPNPNAHC